MAHDTIAIRTMFLDVILIGCSCLILLFVFVFSFLVNFWGRHSIVSFILNTLIIKYEMSIEALVLWLPIKQQKS